MIYHGEYDLDFMEKVSNRVHIAVFYQIWNFENEAYFLKMNFAFYSSPILLRNQQIFIEKSILHYFGMLLV